MKQDEIERYLGDMIGGEVTEEQTLHLCFEKMTKAGYRWRRVKTSILARSLIANTVLLSTTLYRASLNVFSNDMIDKIRRKIKAFVWNKDESKRFRVGARWEKVVAKKSEGGLGLMDVGCAFDATGIRWIKRLAYTEQKGETAPPWKAWIVMKIRLFKCRVAIKGNIWKTKPKATVTYHQDLSLIHI